MYYHPVLTLDQETVTGNLNPVFNRLGPVFNRLGPVFNRLVADFTLLLNNFVQEPTGPVFVLLSKQLPDVY